MPSPHEPRSVRVDTYWRMRSRQSCTRILECALYQLDDGRFEVRCGYLPDDWLYSKLLRDRSHGDRLASELRDVIVRTDAFDEISAA